MKSKGTGFFSRFRRSDKIILGLITAMVVLMIILNIMDSAGLKLINGALMFYLPVMTLVALVGWGIYALIRRMKSRVGKLALGSLAVLVLMMVVTVGFAYLSFVSYTALPHAFQTLEAPSGKHRIVLLWQFDSDVERNEATIQARKEARLAAYPDSDPETLADDVTVAFRAYPTALFGQFYRANADVEGDVFLAYTKNIAPMNVIETAAEATAAPAETTDETAEATEAPAEAVAAPAEEAVGAQATAAPAEQVVIDTHHGVLMMEWLDDEETVHFYVEDPGVAEGGESTLRF